MFAPDGFVALAELWQEYATRHGMALGAEARRTYQQLEAASPKPLGTPGEFGAPADYAEDCFIATLRPYKLTLCSADGRTVAMPSRLEDGFSDVFQKLSVLESTITAEEPDCRTGDADWLLRMGGRAFSPWPHKLADPEVWAETYTLADTQKSGNGANQLGPFHTLPMSFERHRFVVPTALPPWTHDAIDEAFIKSTGSQFAGWSVCLTKRDALIWQRRHLGPGGTPHLDDSNEQDRKTGRPSVVEPVAALLLELFPNGDFPTHKQCIAALKPKLGKTVSEKTIYRAKILLRERNNADETTGQNP